MVDWILRTKNHLQDPPASKDAAGQSEGKDSDVDYFLDFDLAILGEGWERYERYGREVRAEYCHLPDDAFRTGRAAVLATFLEAPKLFRTPVLHEALQRNAQSNLKRELALLSTS